MSYVDKVRNVHVDKTLKFIVQGSPRWQRTLHHRGLRKMALNSRRPGRARKMRQNRRKPPSHLHMTASRNNVQIFKCELRREVRVHRHVENM